MLKKYAGLFFLLSFILAIFGCAPVTIDTTPTGATVYSADGKTRLGSTPYSTSVFVGDKNFTIRKDHYFDEAVKLDFESSRTVAMELRSMPVLIYSKPDAEIFATDPQTSIGRTPMKMDIPETNRTYTLKTAGYYDQNITVGPETTDSLVVKLVRRPIVTLSAAQDGVEVYENNKRIGTAPVKQEILTSRTFELRKPGYFTKSVTLAGAPPYEMAVDLKPYPVITVSASPSGAQIYRTGRLMGKAPVKFAVGEKTVLEVRADRYYPQSITLSPESSAQVNVALKAMPYVMINSQPSGAEVFISGKSAGVAPVEQLIEKDTVIELRKEGFVTKTATLTGADKQVSVTLEAVPPPPPETNAVPAVQPVEEKKTAEVAVAPVQQETPAPQAKKSGMVWVVGGAVIAVAGLILFLIKRKKQ
ncbi:MAG: PEGA domain-containing protein [Kiritimatiellales bacterium]|jgi:hypothetical protein